MSEQQRFTILIIEDDNEDYFLLKEHLSGIEGTKIESVLGESYQKGFELLLNQKFDLCLIDYFLGEKTGLDFIGEASKEIETPPFVMITGVGTREIDLKAMQAGVSDYLTKDELTPSILERTIRYTISERKTKEALKKSEERLNLAINASNEGLWDWDLVNDNIYRSERWAEILGYKIKEIKDIPKIWEKNIHPKDLKQAFYTLNQHLEAKTAHYECEYRMKAKNGNWIWILDKGKVVKRNEDGKPLRMLGTHLDISQRIRDKEQLRQFSHIIEQSPISIMFTNLEGDIEYSNKRFSEITGYSQEEVLGKNPRILKSGKHEPNFYKDFWKTLSLGKDVRTEIQNKR